MKAICTFVLLFMSLGMAAQSNLVEFPYNPDADGNDIIGTADLMELLGIFGEEFSEEGLFVSSDSSFASVLFATMGYDECYRTCYNLPGNWSMSSPEDIFLTDLDTTGLDYYWTGYAHIWVDRKSVGNDGYDLPFMNTGLGIRTSFAMGEAGQPYSSEFANCLCSTHERPKVEYSVCSQQLQSDFLDCCQSKVSEGWYPLNSNPKQSQISYWNQPFWRWAD